MAIIPIDPNLQNQQQTQQPQQPGLLSQIGTGLGDLAGGVGKILPYAIPIGLGAAMGGGVGMGLGGAAAGLASAEGEAGARQQQQQEMALKEKELGLEAQRTDMEIQKGKIALQDDGDRKKFASAIPDATERRMYLDNPDEYFALKQWQGTVNSIGAHPEFVKAHPGMDKDTLLGLGPKAGPEYMKAMLSGKPQITQPTKQPDGTWARDIYMPDGSHHLEKSGEPSSLIVKETAAPACAASADKAAQALQTKAVSALTTEYGKYRAENDKVAAANAKKYSWQTPDPLPHPDLPDSADDYIAKGLDSRVNLLKAKGGAPIDPNAKLKGASVPAVSKTLWGKANVVDPDGRKWNIDAKGKATPAS